MNLILKSPEAKILRKSFVFKIIPMINPDGVVFGNYRTSFLGKDMNRMFAHQIKDLNLNEERILDERLIPEIMAVKRLLEYHQK